VKRVFQIRDDDKGAEAAKRCLNGPGGGVEKKVKKEGCGRSGGGTG